MTTNNVAKPGIRKMARGALERVDELEANIRQVIVGVNQSLQRIQNQMSSLIETTSAVVGLMGEETVLKAIEDARVARAQAKAEQARQAVVQALESGALVTEEIIRDAEMNDDGKAPKDVGSFVALQELNGAREEVPGGYQCSPMIQWSPEFRKALIGQKVGFEMPSGQKFKTEGNADHPAGEVDGKIVVLGVYKFVPPKPKEEKAPEAPPPEAPAAETAAPEAPPAQA